MRIEVFLIRLIDFMLAWPLFTEQGRVRPTLEEPGWIMEYSAHGLRARLRLLHARRLLEELL